MLKAKRKSLLDTYKKTQGCKGYRVSIGKSKWIKYDEFNKNYNLREILDDEVVIEFDMPEDYKGGIEAFQNEVSWPGINLTGVNLLEAGYGFEVWDHGGKSPHLHIHNLPIDNLSADKRKLFKKLFIRKYTPLEFLKFCDTSLCGIHLIAIEWVEHWKGKYSVKKLLNKWEKEE